MKPGAPVGFQVARVFPLPSVLAASGVSPVGIVFTVTWASDTGEPFLVTVISMTCSWFAFTFACFALTSTFSCSPVVDVEPELRAVVPVLLELLDELLELFELLAALELLDAGGFDVVGLAVAAAVCVVGAAEPVTGTT